MSESIEAVLVKYRGGGRECLIPLLQEVQDQTGFLSCEAVVEIGRLLNLPTSKIYGVATFYNQFRFEPRGKHHIQVCRGTACHVKGSAAVLEMFKRLLKIQPGETSKDGEFSLEEVACIGACGLGPVITVDGEFIANVTPEMIPGILKTYRDQGDA
jgi:iron-hydrogenase subunit gamma